MDDIVSEVKQKLNILDLIQSYVPLKKTGVSWKGLCPFHQEKSPSFTVNVDRQMFKCFGCGESGDALSFVMKMEHLTFPEALQMLGDRVGVLIDKKKTPEQYRKEKDQKSQLYALNRFAADVYHKILLEHPRGEAARQYCQERGLTIETLRSFKLGYAPRSERVNPSVLEQLLNKRGFSFTDRREAGNPERFSDRLMFALFDVLGNPIGFTGRTLNALDQPKYLNTPETPIFKKSRILYPLHRAKDAIKERGYAIVVEGQMDVLLAHQLGATQTLACSGTALTAEHLQILSRYTRRVYFCFDNDTAGWEATRKALILAYEQDLEPFVLRIPEEFKDVGELAVAKPAVWEEISQNPVPGVAWQLEERIQTVGTPHHAGNKKQIAVTLLPLLLSIADPIERAHWTGYLAGKLFVSERTIQEALERVRQKNSTHRSDTTAADTRSPAAPMLPATPEAVLLGLLVRHPAQYGDIRDRLMKAYLGTEEPLPTLLKSMDMCYSEQNLTNTTLFAASVSAQLDVVSRLFFDRLLIDVDRIEIGNDPVSIAHDIDTRLGRIEEKSRDRIKGSMAAQIASAEAAGDRTRVQAILKELQTVLKE